MVWVGSAQVVASLSLNLSPCTRGFPRPEYFGGSPHKHKLERKRISLSALMPAVLLTNGAHPYSISHNVIGVNGKC